MVSIGFRLKKWSERSGRILDGLSTLWIMDLKVGNFSFVFIKDILGWSLWNVACYYSLKVLDVYFDITLEVKAVQFDRSIGDLQDQFNEGAEWVEQSLQFLGRIKPSHLKTEENPTVGIWC